MTASLKVIICCLTGSLSLPGVSGHRAGPVNTCDNTALKQTVHRGGTVTIPCKYPEAEESSIKLFCKENKISNCLDLIETHTAKVTVKNRYSLTHTQLGIYTVTISGLTLEDSGKYRCMVRRSENITAVCSTEIILQVLDWGDIPSKKLKGKPGSYVKIDCHYSATHNNNTKFLCKGPSPFSCTTLIQTTEHDRDVTNDRFKIRDNSRTSYFYVYISDLSTADSGTYWCGSHGAWQQSEFNKTLLTVGLIGGVVGSMVLSLVLVIILVLIRNKLLITQVCCAARGSSEANPEEPHYEEILNQQASSGEAERTVYATVNLPVNQIHYASVTYRTDSVPTERGALPEDMNKNGSSTCDYATVMAHPSHSPGEETPQ